MDKLRRGEKRQGVRPRTHRCFETDEGWFLRTREGIPVGPYETKFDADLASCLLRPKLAKLKNTAEVVSAIRCFLDEQSHGLKQLRPPEQHSAAGG